MMWGHGYMGYGGFGMIVWILIIAVIIWFIFGNNNVNNFSKKEDDALDILKKRYAKGEIDKEEFEERKNELLKS